MRQRKDLAKKLNLQIVNLTNKTFCDGPLGLPKLYCDLQELPDYIALYSQPSEYHKTDKTVVSFYNYDDSFDGKKGLYSSIVYNDLENLEKYKIRFQGVKYFISPDYTICGDLQPYRNHFQMGRSREVALWLALECNAKVIPNVACACFEDLQYVIEGLEEVNTVAVSTKGKLDSKENILLLEETIKIVTDRLPKLKNIIIYDINDDSDLVCHLVSHPLENGINVLFLDNIMRQRKRVLEHGVDYKF